MSPKPKVITISKILSSADLEMKDQESTLMKKWSNEYAKDNIVNNGDIFQFLNVGQGENNDGKIIWWNDKPYDFQRNIDDYGSIPYFICVSNFDKADDVTVYHNNIVWFDLTSTKVETIKEGKLNDTCNNKHNYRLLKLTKNNKNWYLYILKDIDINDLKYKETNSICVTYLDEPEGYFDELEGTENGVDINGIDTSRCLYSSEIFKWNMYGYDDYNENEDNNGFIELTDLTENQITINGDQWN